MDQHCTPGRQVNLFPFISLSGVLPNHSLLARPSTLLNPLKPWPVIAGHILPRGWSLSASGFDSGPHLQQLDGTLASDVQERINMYGIALAPHLLLVALPVAFVLQYALLQQDDGTRLTKRGFQGVIFDNFSWFLSTYVSVLFDDPGMQPGITKAWSETFVALQRYSSFCHIMTLGLYLVGNYDWAFMHLTGMLGDRNGVLSQGIQYIFVINIPVLRFLRSMLSISIIFFRPFPMMHEAGWHLLYHVFSSKVEVCSTIALSTGVLMCLIRFALIELKGVQEHVARSVRLQHSGNTSIANKDDPDAIPISQSFGY